ncbi:MAG: CpaD family pilus assembly protein [Sphingorhabdus sp.]
MRNLKFLTAASVCLTLAGCGGSLGTNTSMYSVHQPVVERTNYAIDVNVDGGGIPAGEQQRMAEWFDALDLGYGDRVTIDFGDGYKSSSVTRAVADITAARGILLAGAAPVTSGPVAPGNVRVVVTRSKASVPSCPDWTSTSESNFNGSNHSNHGCASNSNLAAMVADPEDLVRGRESKRVDTNSGKRAVDTYRTKTGGN